MEPVNAIELLGVTKRFGEVVANDNVNLTVRKGEILSILGENGSGKTTLMNMLSGIYFPDEGEIRVNGKTVTIRSPKDSFELGIGMIHQHFKLINILTAAENIILGLPGKERLNLKQVEKEVKELTDRYGFDLNPSQKIYDMSVSQKQTVEIVKVLYRGADILILDEPINGLDPAGIVEMRKLMLRLNKENGLTIIISSHILSELANMATCYGFIDHGQILQEMSAEELEAKEKSYVKVHTSDGEKAAESLSKELQLDASYNEDDDTIYIYFENNTVYPTEEISRFLFEKGYDLYSLEIVKTTLEDFFIELLGGTTIE